MNPTKIAKIGALVSRAAQEDFKIFLCKSIDVSVWLYENMSSINPSMITHQLDIDPNYRPVK